MKKIKFPIIVCLSLVIMLLPFISFSQSSSTVSNIIKKKPGIYIYPSALGEVTILNPHPENLRLRFEYGEKDLKTSEFKESDFKLKSDTLDWYDNKDKSKLTATFTGLNPGRIYQYRVQDLDGVLKPSAPEVFTYPGAGSSMGYGGYLIGVTATTVQNTETVEATTIGDSSVEIIPSTTTTTNPVEIVPGTTIGRQAAPVINLGIPGLDPNALNPIYLKPLNYGGALSYSKSATAEADSKALVQCFENCKFNDLMDLINRVIQFVLFVMVVPIAAIMFTYAGFLMITSGGSTESRSKAKNIFTNAVIGLVIAVASWLIVHEILVILGFEGAWIGF